MRQLTLPDGEGHGEVRRLAARGRTVLDGARVLIDLRQCDGVIEMGMTSARDLHDWLGRHIAEVELSRARSD